MSPSSYCQALPPMPRTSGLKCGFGHVGGLCTPPAHSTSSLPSQSPLLQPWTGRPFQTEPTGSGLKTCSDLGSPWARALRGTPALTLACPAPQKRGLLFPYPCWVEHGLRWLCGSYKHPGSSRFIATLPAVPRNAPSTSFEPHQEGRIIR